MTLYCDRVTWGVVTWVCRQKLARSNDSDVRVLILDDRETPWTSRLWTVVLRQMRCRPEEVPFFAGHLRTSAGEAVRPAARKAAFGMAAEGAAAVLAAAPGLCSIDARWQRHTLRLALAKRLWLAAEHVTLRVSVANALAREAGTPAVVAVEWPPELPARCLSGLTSDIPVVVTGRRSPGWRAGRFSLALYLGRRWVRRVRSRRGAAASTGEGDPALLVLQEDDVSFDLAVRRQPHWLTWAETPPFRTVVLRLNELNSVDLTPEQRETSRIEVVDQRGLAGSTGSPAVLGPLRADVARAAFMNFAAWSASTSLAAGHMARVLLAASRLARVCHERQVRAFMTCENYALEADAMQLLAGPMKIRTLSYQYSTMPYASLAMATTADEVVTFSPMFHARFVQPGYTPPAFRDCGYVYSSSFPQVRDRARARRTRMSEAGARFVVGVFDESVQRDKYGLVSLRDYEQELLELLEWLQRDPSVGLVLKTQFLSHHTQVSVRVAARLATAVKTGRLEVPVAGRHRNVILPAEVAASCDITIGHAIGGTASLEAALVGCRSLILNTYNVVTDADPTLARADIVYPSMSVALDAIDALRSGKDEAASLGDWSPILHEFDPFADEDASARLFAVLGKATQH